MLRVNYGPFGFQPAVSPISNRQHVLQPSALCKFKARAGWKHCDTAGWKPVGNLRYDFVHTLQSTMAGGQSPTLAKAVLLMGVQRIGFDLPGRCPATRWPRQFLL